MEFFVYILFSLKDRMLYVGQTNNLKERFAEHNNGKVKSTKSRIPLIILHKEIYTNRTEAIRREKYLKSLYSAKFKQKLVKDFLNKNKF
ncbi:MAG: putative endonuclease [Parcubacteria group bacterium LiPW_39]|nr:MAG: putative endonuclease [Parcubacteria group bacterium LiPW_39]